VVSDKLAGISTFMIAAEAGSFSAAGEQLHLTRAAVSNAVARLEKRLGVRLFQRTTRSFALTEDGQLFYEHCSRALAEIDSVVASFSSRRD
jgi:DNA-binding transcriptional LysR family regulator